MEPPPIKCPYAKRRKFLCQEAFQSHEEAAKHLIRHHNAQPLLLNERGRYICHYSKNFSRSGCQETFTTQKATQDHLKRDHKDETEFMECLLSENCEINCHSHEGLRGHVEYSHRTQSHRCTWPGCQELFKSSRGVYNHVRSSHTKVRLHCQVAGCGKKYKNESGLAYHMSVHEKEKDKSASQVLGKQTKKATASETSKKKIKREKLKRPFEQCDQELISRNTLVKHLRSLKHKGDRIPCKQGQGLW